jgi:hypothetical protein
VKRKDFKSFVLRNIQKEVILTEKIEEKVYANHENFVYMDKTPHFNIDSLHKIATQNCLVFMVYTFCF